MVLATSASTTTLDARDRRNYSSRSTSGTRARAGPGDGDRPRTDEVADVACMRCRLLLIRVSRGASSAACYTQRGIAQREARYGYERAQVLAAAPAPRGGAAGAGPPRDPAPPARPPPRGGAFARR